MDRRHTSEDPSSRDSLPAGAATASTADLLRADSPVARTSLYLRLLYSRRQAGIVRETLVAWPDELPVATMALLKTVDFERLGIEQAARVRNLRFQLKTMAPALFDHLGAGPDLNAVESFCESEDFWRPRGRSLVEGFCLFLASHHFPIADRRSMALVRLCAVVSGLSAAPDQSSPWPDGVLVRAPAPDVVVEESFLSPWPLVDAAGTLAAPSTLQSIAESERRYQVRVALRPDGLFVSCHPPEVK